MFIKFCLLSLLIISTSVYSRIAVTNRPVDLLIVVKASLRVLGDNGLLECTRDGSFIINRNGHVVDSFGRKLYPGFEIPQYTISINIDLDGQVDIYLKGKKKSVRIGQIGLFISDDNQDYSNVTGTDHGIEIHQGKLYIK